MAQQFADPEFDAKVDRPAFTDRHPSVFLDEAHNNFHTADGRYKPFADLIRNDGYNVTPSKNKFTSQTLKGCAILVVANAFRKPPLMRSPVNPAFETAECDAVLRVDLWRRIAFAHRRSSPLKASNDRTCNAARCRDGQEHACSTRRIRKQGYLGN